MIKSFSRALVAHAKSPTQRLLCSKAEYVQGQSPEPKIREYFYYIDHQGMLFLDDSRMKNFTSCFKEKKFLHFFFSRLKTNEMDRYFPAFPYISPCGRERNFVRCDDQPFVYTHVLGEQGQQTLSYGYAAELLTVPFQPDCIYVHPDSGRVYHPAPGKVGGVGLVRSQLAIEFSQHFVFDSDGRPVGFKWAGKEHRLRSDWVPDTAQFYSGGLVD